MTSPPSAVLTPHQSTPQDSLAFKAFQSEGILTMGADHFEVDWEAMWLERLADTGKAAGGGNAVWAGVEGGAAET